MGVDGNSMNDTRKKGGLQTVLQQQQSKKLYKKRLKGTCRLADYCFIFSSIYIFEFPPQLSANELRLFFQINQSGCLVKVKRSKNTAALEPMHLPQALDFEFTKVNIKTSDVYDGNFLS